MIIKKDGKWITDTDTNRFFNLKIDALNHEKIVKNKTLAIDTRKLSDLIDAWYRMHGQQLKNSKERYRSLYFICNKLNNMLAINVTADIFARYREERIKEVSLATVNREHSYLRAMYNELERLGIIDYHSDLARVRQFKERDNELRYLSSNEILTLLNCCKNHNSSLLLIVKICLSTGARWGEAQKLKQRHIINSLITFVDTKSNKNRSVPINEELFNELTEFFKLNKSFLYCKNAFRKAIKQANIKLPNGQSTHVLRHTFAAHFIMNGGNIVVLRDILGHSSITTTMQYSHLAPNFLNDAILLNPLDNPAD